MQPCRGQMMEFESPREIPHVVRAGTHYLVPRSARRVVVGTTAEYAGFEKRVTAEGLQSILNGAMKFAPFLKECAFLRSWAGLRPDTSDHLPILGYSKLDNLILATGHFRHGILLAPITAQANLRAGSRPRHFFPPGAVSARPICVREWDVLGEAGARELVYADTSSASSNVRRVNARYCTRRYLRTMALLLTCPPQSSKIFSP